jgi:4-amino-4-deoxy-L-arabinose transferase-like glycosyltransferase
VTAGPGTGAGFSSAAPGSSARTLAGIFAIAVAAAVAWGVLSPPGANDLVGGDEGYYGTMARNVLSSPAQVVSLSLTPLGLPGDKPPLYPLLISAFVSAWGATPAAVRAPSALCAVAIPLGIGVLLLPATGGAAAAFATALLATLPWFTDASRGAAAELPLTAFALLALIVLAANPRSRARAVVAGALLGLSFLCKLWLVAPAALAAVALLSRREQRTGVVLALLVGSALAVASLHLAMVAAFRPADLEHWRHIYLGRSLVERVSGEGYADYWRRPAGIYWATVTRAFGLVLPWLALGVEAAWRRRSEPVPRALLVWASGLLLLSAFGVKAGGYAYVVVPAWCGLAALGAHAVANGHRPSVRTLIAGALLTSPLGAHWQANGLPAAIWAGVWLAGGAFVGLMRLAPSRARHIVVAWASVALVLGTLRSAQRLSLHYHTPGYAVAAAFIAPRLADIPPDHPCYLAPEAPSFAFHLFRTGGYWATPDRPWTAERLAAVRADTGLRVFVVDTTRSFYGGWPDAATLAWLEGDLREVTAAIPWGPAREHPLRVFVR